ncbi:hypothetical protein HII31_02776 [Pseudocercospora fuligena]|uniref:Uncharacterized protein n=1 Tax=Pseudocercospora fuligena TaxID=685502 RepID=A0A8H6RRN1_9PEZI|nr:hypothetical protein HII31_02776 [Pseudocercospora fuligena]
MHLRVSMSNRRDKVTPSSRLPDNHYTATSSHQHDMANREQGSQASCRRSSLTIFNNADIIRRMNAVDPDQSPGSDFTTTFGQPPLHHVQVQSQWNMGSKFSPSTIASPPSQQSPVKRQPSKAGRALKNIYTKAKDKAVKFVDEALPSPGHPDNSYPNALAPKREVQISLPIQDETWLENFTQAVTGHNADRTLIPIENAQDLRRQKATYAGERWMQTNFVKDKDGHERQRLQSTKELKEGLLNGTVAYVGGSKLDFALDAGAGLISYKDFADKNRESAFFQGKPRSSSTSIAPRLKHPLASSSKASAPAQATASAQPSSSGQPSRTLPTVPVNHSAVDAQKPAAQAKVPRRKIDSTWGALIDAANKSPSNSSEEVIAPAPIADSSERARRRRVTVIDSQAFDPVDQPGSRDSFANVSLLAHTGDSDDDDEDEAFNFSSPPSPVSSHGATASDLTDEAERLESIDLRHRYAPFDNEPETSLQIDTHIRDGHVSWYVRDQGAQASRHARQERTDGIPSPTAQTHPREEDEAAALWKRLEEQQQEPFYI